MKKAIHIILYPLVLCLLILLSPYFLFCYLKEKWEYQKEHGYVWGKKVYLTFNGDIHGAGTLTCLDCGKEYEIIGFIHGVYDCRIGRQCQYCGFFFDELNESQKAFQFSPRNKDLFCPKCGHLYAKKEESILKAKSRQFLFCPTCKSKHLSYKIDYIT